MPGYSTTGGHKRRTKFCNLFPWGLDLSRCSLFPFTSKIVETIIRCESYLAKTFGQGLDLDVPGILSAEA